MKKYKEKLVQKVVGYTCDICGGDCSEQKAEEGCWEMAQLVAQWGYWSSKDGTTQTVEMCEKCFDKVAEFIKSLGGKIQEKSNWDHYPEENNS